MAACKDHCLLPGLRVYKGRLMCPSRSDALPHQLGVIRPCAPSIFPSCGRSSKMPFNHLSPHHTDSFNSFLSKPINIETQMQTHSQPAIRPHAVQAHQQSEPEACSPSGPSFSVGPSVQEEREPANPPILPKNRRDPIVPPSRPSHTSQNDGR